MVRNNTLDELEINTYELRLPLNLAVFDSYSDVEETLRGTVARSIVDVVPELTEDDVEYIRDNVTFDDGELESLYDEACESELDAYVANVETVTELALLDGGDSDE